MTALDSAELAHPEDIPFRDLVPGKESKAKNPYLRKSLQGRHLDDKLKWHQVLYADWLANNPAKVTYKEKRRKLSELSRIPYDNIAMSYVKGLEARDDFKLLTRKFEEDAIASARAKLEGGAPLAAEVAVKAVNHLNDRMDADEVATDDLKLVPVLTGPFIERAWPKKQEVTAVAQVIQINLSPAQDGVLETAEYFVEGEEIVSDVS